VVVDGPEAAVTAVAPRLRAGDAVLVKASRVAGLERVADALLTWGEPGGRGVSPRQRRRQPPRSGT
jgi:UDP-N-acetylmuramoyl-tripeptide--D-alanyl-D-alanine ligase